MIVKVAVRVIRLYQEVVSPIIPPRCRFHPSCSQYAVDALLQYGLPKGLLLSLRRISRCHPFHPGGYDPA